MLPTTPPLLTILRITSCLPDVPRGTGDAEGNFEEGIPPGDVSLIELEAQISPVNPEKEDGDILGK